MDCNNEWISFDEHLSFVFYNYMQKNEEEKKIPVSHPNEVIS